MDANNNWRDAWEALIGDITKLNTTSTAVKPPTEILILALEDGHTEGSPTATGNIYEFKARILGENSPHVGMPMPCFDFVKEVWGDASSAASAVRRNDSDVLQEFPPDEDTNAGKYAQNLVAGYPLFTTIKASKSPRLGDIWVATGVDWNNPTGGTATECRYPAHENSPIMNERIWEPAIAKFFAAVKKGNKTEESTGTLSEGCSSLMRLFEEELSSLSEKSDPVNCHDHPEDSKCSWWMRQHGGSDNWYLTPKERKDGERGWNYGLTPPLKADGNGNLREMWEVFQEEIQIYVNEYIKNYLTLKQSTNIDVTKINQTDVPVSAADINTETAFDVAYATSAGELKNTFSVSNNGVTRTLWEAIGGSGARTPGSKHGAGLALDLQLNTSLQPDNKWGGLSDDRKYLYKNQLLTDAFISFTADWNSRRDPEHQVLWGGTFNGGASALGIPARSRGITEFHHWELTNPAIYLAFENLGSRLAPIGAPPPADFLAAAQGTKKMEGKDSVLLALYQKLNDGNNLAGADEFGNVLREQYDTYQDAVASAGAEVDIEEDA